MYIALPKGKPNLPYRRTEEDDERWEDSRQDQHQKRRQPSGTSDSDSDSEHPSKRSTRRGNKSDEEWFPSDESERVQNTDSEEAERQQANDASSKQPWKGKEKEEQTDINPEDEAATPRQPNRAKPNFFDEHMAAFEAEFGTSHTTSTPSLNSEKEPPPVSHCFFFCGFHI